MHTPPAGHGIRTVLFDLDGTLADTAPDLAYALNTVLKSKGKSPLALEKVRPAASHGSIALIRLGFDIESDHPEFESLRQAVIEIYRENIANETRLFSGMAEVLQAIEAQGMNWGIVTNKPGNLTEPLLAALDIKHRAACIVSGDTLAERKPHPAPLLYACEQAGSDAAHCLYIGDAQRDIVAGNHAGMKTLVALFGYIDEHEQPADWGADGMVNNPNEILSWLRLNHAPLHK